VAWLTYSGFVTTTQIWAYTDNEILMWEGRGEVLVTDNTSYAMRIKYSPQS
jgi:hypothetical protein